MDSHLILKLFHDTFELRCANRGSAFEAFQSLRYQVHCLKFKYAQGDFYTGRESDAYDSHAIAKTLIYKETGAIVGGLRLILPKPKALNYSFPIQGYCASKALNAQFNALFADLKVAELSRFCISPLFLRRDEDTAFGSRHVDIQTHGKAEGRIIPLIKLGLLQALLEMAIQAKISHCCAMLEPILIEIFKDMGIHFQIIGEAIPTPGERLPCWIALEDLCRDMQRERPLLWEIVTENGKLWQAFKDQVLDATALVS